MKTIPSTTTTPTTVAAIKRALLALTAGMMIVVDATAYEIISATWHMGEMYVTARDNSKPATEVVRAYEGSWARSGVNETTFIWKPKDGIRYTVLTQEVETPSIEWSQDDLYNAEVEAIWEKSQIA